MLLVHDSKFGDKVPMQLGTHILDTALWVITKNELSNASNWQDNVKIDPMEVLLDLNWIQGDIKTTKRIAILPIETVKVQGLTKVRCHTKRVHVVMEAPVQHYSEQDITTLTYTEPRLGSSKVVICMRTLSARPVKIPARTIIGSVSSGNILLPMLAQKIKTIEENKKRDLMETNQN